MFEEFNEGEYKNPRVAAAVKALIDLQVDYEAARQGNVLASTLLSLSNVFHSDSKVILKLIVPQNTLRAKGSNPKRVIFIDPNPDMVGPEAGCASCPQETIIPSTPKAPEKVHANTPRTYLEVLNMFSGDRTQMVKYARQKGISIKKSMSEVDIAKALLEGFK